MVEANGGRVFADEIHAPLLYPGGRHIPYASLSEVTARHTVTGTAASKGWNLPGLKCAQLVLSNDADAALWAERGFTFEHGTSTPGAWAAAAAYTDGGQWLDNVVGYLDGNRAAPRRAARGPAARGRLPAARGHLPRLARLPRAARRAGHRGEPGGLLPRARRGCC